MKILGFDSETNNRYNEHNSCRSIQLFDPDKNYCYVAHRTDEMAYSSDLWHVSYVHRDDTVTRTGRDVKTSKLTEVLTSPNHGLVTHSGSFDCFISMRDLGCTPRIVDDTFILGCLIPWTPNKSRSLDALMKSLVNENYDKAKFGGWQDHDWSKELTDEAILYAGRDAIAVYDLRLAMLEHYKKYANVSYRMEVDLIPLFAEMKLKGLYANKNAFDKAYREVTNDFLALEQEVFSMRGYAFNTASKEQIRKWLFDEVGLKPIEITKSGKGSVNKKVLQQLNHPVASKLIELSESQSIKSSITSIREANEFDIVGGNMVFHPEAKSVSVNQDSTRIYYDPSVTQWPWAVKESIVNPDGLCYYADVKQFEIMIASYASNEESLINSYKNGGDIHSEIASNMNCSRKVAKEVEFATIYGSVGHSIVKSLGIPFEEAEKFVNDFLSKYPNIALLREKVYSRTDSTNMAYTVFGRARRLAFPTNQWEQKEIRRQSFNYLCQSTSGEIWKNTMLKLYRENIPNVRIASSVFDSILVYIPSLSEKKLVDEVIRKSLRFTVNGREWYFRFDSGVGKNWLEAKENAQEYKGE